MGLTLSNYLFLSKYIPLPLSAIKIIEKNKSHPFQEINKLNKKEILKQLKLLNRQSNVSIRKIAEKSLKIKELLKQNIFEKIQENIKKWNESGIKIVTYFDNDYPISLKDIKNPPKVIFIKGNFNFDYEKAVSIIGTRDPTEYGSYMAKKIGYQFAKLGFTVINGFARGIDTIAMKGTLEAGGSVIGVLGCGLLNPYPKENTKLFHEVIEKNKGVFISEKLPEKPITKSNLATRNRISSALSIGNIFIEGGKNSGIKWQLKYSKEQGKPIIVLKPKEDHEQTYMPNFIIKNEKNPYIIEKIDDIKNIADAIQNIEYNQNNDLKKKENSLVQKSLDNFQN